MEKLNEYVQTGTLQILEREKLNPVNILTDVYGIGPKKAKELVENGITSIDKLRENQHLLNDIQKVGLRYYEDILKRIPRSEIEDYKVIFENSFPKVVNSKMEIVGSYRRGAQNSGDIDIIITSNSANVFTTFVDNLIKEKIITYVLSRGPTKCLVIAKIPSSDSYRRVDFLYTSLEEFPFAILYFTGSKIFNTVMRHIALEKGYTMNEHGLYKKQVGKEKEEKVDFSFKNEKDISKIVERFAPDTFILSENNSKTATGPSASTGYVFYDINLKNVLTEDMKHPKNQESNSRMQAVIFLNWILSHKENKDKIITDIVRFAKSESDWSSAHLIVK
jgi:DNA polymerase beta